MAEQVTKNTDDNTRDKVLVGVVILVLAVIGASAYFYHSHKSTPSQSAAKAPEKGLFNQTVSNEDNFTLAGNKDGEGVAFFKPVDYKLQVNQKGQASLADTISNGQQHAFIGALHVASVSIPVDQAKGLAKNYNDAFKNPSKQAYKDAVASVTGFISARFSPLYNLTVNQAANFTSSTIKSNAWAFNVSATPKQKQAAGSPLEDYKGRAVLAVGTHAMYYFVVYNTTYNWNNNVDQFNKVLQSLKIDQ